LGGHTVEEITDAPRFLAKRDRALARADKVTAPFEWRVAGGINAGRA
jgi:hypothetical protein